MESDTIYQAAHVYPSPQQLAWQKLEFMVFFHFTVNTFTDMEWGTGVEDPSVFNPTHLDVHQWLRVAHEAGMRLAILTSKHHDGFCLWPSQYTEHSVRYSPYKSGKGDVVDEFVEACRAFDIKVGFYLSPWDRHEQMYGTAAYNDYFKNQLTELLTRYGPIAEVWFDGACGEGPNGKRQVYDWAGYYQVIRKYQPDAVIAISGPDVRWVGNEHGIARESEWCVLPVSYISQEDIAAQSQQEVGKPPDIDVRYEDLGSREKIMHAKQLVWYPAECDVSIRPGWFYHSSEDGAVKSPEALVDIYFKSVGRNSVLLLNLPPDRRGLIHENDARSLQRMQRLLDDTFSVNRVSGSKVKASCEKEGFPATAIIDGDPTTYWTTNDWQETAELEFELEGERRFNVVMLQEHIAVGQRIEKFVVEIWSSHGWQVAVQGGTVGYKRLLRCDIKTTTRVRVLILGSRFAPTLNHFGLYTMSTNTGL